MNNLYFQREISYCPQTSAVDPLLTVEEVIQFYGKLRRVQNIPQVISINFFLCIDY